MWWLPLVGQALSSLIGGITAPKPPTPIATMPKFTQPTWYYPSLPKREPYIFPKFEQPTWYYPSLPKREPYISSKESDVAYQQMLSKIGEATKEAMKGLAQSYQKRGLYESGLLSEAEKKLAEQQQKAVAEQAANIYLAQAAREAGARMAEEDWRRQMAATMAQAQMGREEAQITREAQARMAEEDWRRQMAYAMAQAQMALPAQRLAAQQWAYGQIAPYQQAGWSGWQQAIPLALEAWYRRQPGTDYLTYGSPWGPLGGTK